MCGLKMHNHSTTYVAVCNTKVETTGDEDIRSTDGRAADKTQLIAARIRTALKGLEEDRDAQEILASFSNKGF